MSVSRSSKLDLAEGQGIDELLGFYHVSPKETATGLAFESFVGLYYYLLTGRCHRELLKGNEVESFRSKPWVWVPDLDEHLYMGLVIHSSKHPLLDLKLQGVDEIIWTMDRPLNGAEKRWLIIVNRYLSRMV